MTRVPRPIAIVVSRFPLVTETFILRELIELERQGQPILLVPLIRETPGVVHEEARPWVRRALYTPYLSWAIVRANLRALRAHPVRYFGVLAKLVGGAIRHPVTLAKTLVLWPKLVFLAGALADRGVRHIHAHFATHPATAAWVASHFTSATYSITVHAHDLFVDRALLAPKVRRAAFVRCISEFNRTFLLDRIADLDAGKVSVIHVGVPRVAMETATATSGRGYATVLCIAALKPYKGVRYLLDACRQLAEQDLPFHCRIIGDGPLRATLERQARRLGLQDRVWFEGARPQDVVARAIKEAAVVVHPSIVAATGQMDGIPVALMEAMAAERPVVASELSGIPELVEHEHSGLLVKPADASGLAAAIARILGDPDLGARLGRAGAEAVRRAFDLTDTVTHLATRINPLNEPVALPASSPALRVERTIARPDSELIELSDGTPGGVWVLKRHTGGVHNGRGPVDRARTEYAVLSRIDAQRSSQPDAWSGFAAPRPVGFDVSAVSILMTACRGTRLDALIRSARDDAGEFQRAVEAVHRTGRWLRLFQASDHAEDRRDVVSPLLRGAAADLDRCLRDGVLPRRASATLGLMERLAEAMAAPSRQSTLAHGDFWPGNVLIGDELSVVDFEAADCGFRYEDAGYFLNHLDLYFWRPWTRSSRDVLRTAFLRGFAGDSAIDTAGLRLGRIAAALRALANSTHQPPLMTRALRRRLFRNVILDTAAPDGTRTGNWQLAEAG